MLSIQEIQQSALSLAKFLQMLVQPHLKMLFELLLILYKHLVLLLALPIFQIQILGLDFLLSHMMRI